jgi:hypothetical protein
MSKRDAMEKVREASYFSSRQTDGGIKEPPLKDLDLQRIGDRENRSRKNLQMKRERTDSIVSQSLLLLRVSATILIGLYRGSISTSTYGAAGSVIAILLWSTSRSAGAPGGD